MLPSLLENVFCWSDQATLLRTLLFSVSSENENDDHNDDHDDGHGGYEMHV